MRLGAGSMKRSPRVFPDNDIRYKDWIIPKGVGALCKRMKTAQARSPELTKMRLILDANINDHILHAHGLDGLPGAEILQP